YILDKAQQLVPAGITGEIYIGGRQVAQGYLNRAELTSGRFVRFAGQRVYRTGDIGRWLPDGRIDYLGRQDDQVKVRGYRIELGEIEHALQALAGITAVVVITYKKEDGEHAIAAYFTSDGAKDSIALRQQLLLKLPEYMVPAHFIQLPRLPLTANGKIDRNALPAPGEKVADQNTPYVAPRNAIEISLVDTCERILKKTGISITTSFLDLGGDSIKAILLSSQMKQKGYTVKVGDVLKYPLLEELATHVKILDNNDAEQKTVTGDVVLMPVQQWFLSGSYDQKHHYNQSMMLSSRIPVAINVLDQSLAYLVKHHDALRMVYRNDGNVWKQYNQGTEQPCYHLEEYDLREDADAHGRMRATCNALQSGINLEQGPLVKAGLFRLPAGDRLLLVIHHLVIDGVSWRILLEDLSTLYLQLSKGQHAQLPLKSDSFRDWAAHQQRQANGGVLSRSLDYWATIVNSSELPLRKDLTSGINNIGNSVTEGFSLDENITSLLQTKAHRVYHTDVNDILLSGLLRAVQEVFPQEHLLLTMEGHGREEIGNSVNIARTIGWFTSMYPVLLETNAGEEAVDTLIRVKDHLRRVPDKGIGFGMLRYLHPDGEKELGKLRESDITFNYLGDFGSGFSAGGGESVFDYGEEGKGLESALSYEPESPLTVTAILTSGQLHVSIRYSKEQYYPETIARLSQHYADHLASLIRLLSEMEGSELTPGDLTYKGLSPVELKILNNTGDVTDIYTLSPLQGGLYYHWLAGIRDTMYVEQMSYRLRGTFDLNILHTSYTYLTNRHAVLRTSFHHGYGDENIQVVHLHMKPDFRYQKLSGEQVASFKIADREEGFNLHEGPAMRLSVLELGPDEYEFVWTHHHILMDGWCAGVLIDEFYQIYRQLIQGKTPLLPPVSPYVNYIRWLDVQDHSSSVSYWKSYLQGYEQQAVIPFGQQEGSDYEGGVVRLNLDKELVSGIRNVCRSIGITENTFMQGAWSYLLGRYNNTEDVVFGAVVSGRPPGLTGVEHMIGLFINTIPVRVRYKGDMTAPELLQSLQQDAIGSLPHHYIKLSDIQSASLPGHQLFDHILVYENYPVEELISDGLSGGMEHDGASTLSLESSEVVAQTNYDFTIVVAPAGAGIQVLFRYNCRRYPTAAVQRISEHFNRVLTAFVNPAAVKLKELCYLGEPEKQTLLHTFNDTAVLYERDVTLPELFRRQVVLQPDATALVYANRSFTYRELNEKSGHLASYLHAHYTLAPEDLIGIKLQRSEWLIISLLAVLKAGCAYVPVDPAYPEERQRYIAADSGYKACIDEALLASFNEEDYAAITYHAVKENQLAYVLYTSGSSGLPKGCMLEHKGLINRLRWMWEHYGFTTGDVVLQKTTFTFDVSVWELFVPLCFGCKMILCEDEAVYSPTRLAALISTYKISNAHFVPVMLQSFIENTDIASLTSLKRVFASGEALSPATVAAWYAVTDVPLYNLYGPTETSIEVSYYDTLPGTDKVPIGKPIANTHLHILDQYGQLVPVGVAAEIHIGGIQLARGYHNRPELTAEKFIDHPLLNERLYRTGDLGRWLPDGNIEYLGRIDDQVKIRGYRIELGEIEQALLALPGIHAAVVTAFKPDSGGQLLAAYYISETPPDAALLRQQLLLKLPEYMVPAYFTPLEHFPLTASGKVNRKALPAPGTGATDNYVAPRSPVEVILTGICERMFKRKEVSIQASFLNLGGDSIKAILLASQLKQRGYSVKVGDILKYPVLEELALHVHAADNIITEQSAVEGDVALMPVQQWFLSGTYDRKHHYNQSVILSSRLPVEVTVLDQSLAHLVKHHDALRMVFRYEDGVWQQYNQGTEKPDYHLEEYDLREHADPEGRMTILCYGLQESINLEQGPLVKAGLFHLPAGDRLLLVIHHLVVDGVSWRILLEDLSTLYVQLGQGQRPQLPLKSDSFRDWANHQQQQANSPALSGELAYWTTLTANSGEPLPLDMPSGANVIGCSASEGFLLEENITHLLQTKAHRVYHTDINDILLSCLLQSVQEIFQQDSLLLRLEGHGREETGGGANISRTVGWFTTMYPVLLESMPGEEAEDTLIRVKDHLRRLPNKGIGYGMLRYLNAIGRERLGGLRSGDITFNYLGDFGSGVSSGEGESVFDYATEHRGQETGMSYEQETALTVTGILVSGRLRVRIRYSKEQFHQETINRLSDCYANRLRSLITTLSEKDGSYLTAGDLTYKGLSFAALQELNSKKDIVDIYALSPLQEGLYYHWLSGTSRTMYVEQMSYRLHGSFDVEVLQQSYAYLVGRHAMLRTGFHHGYGKDNIQVVRRYNVPDFRYRELEEAKVAAYKISDREEGFNLHEGPGMRLTVLELKPGEYEFIWTHHHILMDGWCAGVLINEFYQIYRSLLNATTPVLAPVIPYVNYIRWLAEQDQDSSQAYWESYLSGYEQAASIPFRKADSEGYIGGEEKLVLSGEEVAGINSLCRSAGITENTFMQGVWSYLLGRYNNTEDVVFGAVVSGRPAGLAGVENMIGLFINTIPVRVRYAGSMTALELLQQLQQDAISSMAHHYVKLSDIQSRSVPGNRLFD
ncbi:non-ribosomal peptide synthetase, partial [Chitinophaga ginsengisegetis]|uniref:non-ribosomal peptide synthetase n=2 Tax=Chitinophaga ginsengisegetis TaxID=393003 RepID=UPI00285BD8C9